MWKLSSEAELQKTLFIQIRPRYLDVNHKKLEKLFRHTGQTSLWSEKV